MRRQDRQISTEATIAILRKGEFGVLSMCTTESGGYGIPLNYAYVNNEIYFHCAPEGSKLTFLKNNNRVSFCVVGHTEILPSQFGTIYESAIVFGKVAEVEADEKRKGLLYLIEKYSKDFIPEGLKTIDQNFENVQVLKLSIQSLTGKARN